VKQKVLAIGELLWDVLPDEKKLGGAPANLAYRLNNLGNPTWLLTRIGNDTDGRQALEILKEYRFNTEYIQIDNQYPTGTVDVFFDADKNPDYTINKPVAYDFINWNDGLHQLASSINCIVYGTLVQRSVKTAGTLYRLIDTAGDVTRFCDVNLRKDCYHKTIVERSLQKATIAKLNHHEAKEIGAMFGLSGANLTGLVSQLIDIFNLEICLVTLENQGGLAIEKNGNIHYSPGYKVSMQDPLGAGDAFSAAFLNHYLQTGEIKQALEWGNLFGAIVVGQKGAMQPITGNMIEEFKASQHHYIIMEEYKDYWQAVI